MTFQQKEDRKAMIYLTIKGVGHRMALDPSDRDDREAGKKLLHNAVVVKSRKKGKRK